MLKRFKDVKVDVTVNGSGFDTPSDITIQDEGEIQSCSLIFPGGNRSRHKILKNDVIKVFVGLDGLPDYPQFTGYLTEEAGISNTMMELSGALYRATKDYRRVQDIDNLDGAEIGNAIETVFQAISELNWMSTNVEITNPAVFVPLDTRFAKGISKYDLMKEFRDMAVDSEDPVYLGRYTFFVHGDIFYFRKIPNPKTASPWVEIAYGDTLLSFDYENANRHLINRATVVGKDTVFGEYENAHRKGVDGLLEDDPISNSNVLSNGEAREIARSSVLSSIFAEMPLMIDSPLLLDTIPNVATIEITGAPYGLSDKYLLKSRRISVGDSLFNVTGKVSTPVDFASEAIYNIIGLERDVANNPASA